MQARNFIMRMLIVLMLALVFENGATAQAPRGTAIEIESDPPGASVFLDDSPFGVTPLRLQGKIKPGRHLLRLDLEGHEKYEKIVDVSSVARINVKMTPLVSPDEEKKPISLQRNGESPTISAPLPGGGQPEKDPGKDSSGSREADRRSPLPDETINTGEDDSIPLRKSWILGVSIGGSGATVDHALGSDYISFAISIQRKVLESLAIESGFGLNLQTSLDARPGADSDERGSLRGFEFHVAIPFYFFESSGHSFSLAPEAGIVNHGYTYTDFDASGVLLESAAFRYIQTRLAAALAYQYIPYDKYSGTIGFGAKIALQSFGETGGIPGALSVHGSGSLLVRF